MKACFLLPKNIWDVGRGGLACLPCQGVTFTPRSVGVWAPGDHPLCCRRGERGAGHGFSWGGEPVPSLRVWGGGADFTPVTEKLVGNAESLGVGREEDVHPHHLVCLKGHLSVQAPGSSARGMVWEEGTQPRSCSDFPP